MINSDSSANRIPESGKLLKAAFATITEAIFISDAEGRLIEFNDEFVRYHRFRDRAECSQHISDCPKLLDVWFADGRPAPLEQWAMPRALRGETAYNVEYRLRHKETGETWWGSYNFAPLKDNDGNITGAVVAGREITELKRAEQNEEMFATLLQNNPSLLFLKDEEGKYVYLNPAYEKQYALMPDWRGKSDYDFWPKESADLFKENDAKTLESGETCQFLEDSFDLQGNRHCWLCYKFPFTDSQGRRYVGGIGIDSTAQVLAEEERKRAEVALSQLNEELEQRVADRTAELREKDQLLLIQGRQAAMGEMLGNIAHQWRQPLNNLGLCIQKICMLYDLGELNREVINETGLKAMSLINHMSNTIDDFSNFFAPQKEKVEFGVAGAVADSVALIADALKSKHIDVEVVAVDDPVVYGYRNEFAQVLLNILNNAAEALTEKQPLSPTIKATVAATENGAMVTIRDNAGGVPSQFIDRIFDPYFTTKGPHGTGVGLFMSKAIIEKNMGGRLTVSNSPNGAEFKIEI